MADEMMRLLSAFLRDPLNNTDERREVYAAKAYEIAARRQRAAVPEGLRERIAEEAAMWLFSEPLAGLPEADDIRKFADRIAAQTFEHFPMPEGLRERIEGVPDSLRPAPGWGEREEEWWRVGLSDATHSILTMIATLPPLEPPGCPTPGACSCPGVHAMINTDTMQPAGPAMPEGLRELIANENAMAWYGWPVDSPLCEQQKAACYEHADRIIALLAEFHSEAEKCNSAAPVIPAAVGPALVWGDNEFGEPRRRLMLGGLYVGEIQRHTHTPRTPWRAWFSDECEGNSVGVFATEDEARKAVETAFRERVPVQPAAVVVMPEEPSEAVVDLIGNFGLHWMGAGARREDYICLFRAIRAAVEDAGR